MNLPSGRLLTTVTKELLRGNIGTAFKSLSPDPDLFPTLPEGYFPPVIIDPSQNWTPDDNAWLYTRDGGGYQYFQYRGHNSSQYAYENCPPVQAIINRMAQCFINGKTWILNSNNKESQSPNANKLRALLNNPNPLQTRKQFEAQLYVFVKLFGYSLVLFRKPVGFPDNIDATNMWNIPPTMLNIEETEKLFYQTGLKGIVKEIVITYKNAKTTVNADDIYIVKDFTPSFDSLIIPESRICPLSQNINNVIGALNSRGSLIFDRGALGILSQDPGSGNPMGGPLPMTPDEKKELQQDIRRYGTRHGQYKFIITKAALKWQQIGIATRELMLFEEVEADTMAIADGMNYPYRLLSSTTSNSLGGTDANIYTRNLYQDAIMPEAESIFEQLGAAFGLEALNIRIDKDFTHIAVLQEDKVLAGTARFRLNQALLIEWQNNLLTANEWLTQLGEDPKGPEFDLYYSDFVAAGKIFGAQPNIPAEPGANQSPTTNNQGNANQ